MAVQLIAVAAGLGAPAGFAVSTSMPHRAAASAPERSAAALIGYLARRPAAVADALPGLLLAVVATYAALVALLVVRASTDTTSHTSQVTGLNP